MRVFKRVDYMSKNPEFIKTVAMKHKFLTQVITVSELVSIFQVSAISGLHLGLGRESKLNLICSDLI